MLDEKHFQKRQPRMILHQLFTDIDDFCNRFLPTQNSHRLPRDVKKRNRPKCLCESEIMTIVIEYQMSVYRTFKWFYLNQVRVFWREAFPNLPSYNRFVEMMSEILEP